MNLLSTTDGPVGDEDRLLVLYGPPRDCKGKGFGAKCAFAGTYASMRLPPWRQGSGSKTTYCFELQMKIAWNRVCAGNKPASSAAGTGWYSALAGR